MREMKDSGVAWIGEIPVNFSMMRMKNIGTCRNGLTYSPENLTDETGVLVLRSSNVQNGKLCFEDNVYVDCKIKDDLMVKKGDILICSRNGSRALIGKSAIIDFDITASFGAFMMIFRSNYNPKYIYYILNSNIFSYYLGTYLTATINQLTGANFNSMVIPFCENDTIQAQIVSFLDRKCTQIDALISNAQQQIEKLKAYKQSVITETVTKGLDPDVPMKDSGVEWIGEIPEHWELIPFRYILKERNEKNNPVRSKERLSLSIELGVTLYAEKTTNLDRFKDDFEAYKLAYKGDLVMNSMNMIVGASGVSDYFGCVSPAYYTFYDEISDHITAKYCEYIFRSKTMLRVLHSLGKGIYAIERGDDKINTCRLKVPKTDLKKLLIPQPPLTEQCLIVTYINEKCNQIDQLIALKQQKIEKLQQHKKSLIYEYVTGKKEV